MNSTTLVDLLLSLNDGNAGGITFIYGINEETHISYKQLYHDALRLLYSLQQMGLEPKDELVFQIDDPRMFITIFWACILGGILPVPVTVGKTGEEKAKVLKIWKVLTRPSLITNEKIFTSLKKYIEKKSPIGIDSIEHKTIFYDTLTYSKPGTLYKPSPGDSAFIQFSSGSTGDPKGVVLTHKNILVNTQAVIKRSAITGDDALLSWMPLTHDMGLILAHLTGVRSGIRQYIMPPALFIQNPLIWMDKTHEHRASLLYSPNFGFKYFLDFLTDTHTWDLSCIRLLYNGAEPISHSICKDFTSALAPYGLSPHAMYPGYGLAEATVGVAFPVNTRAGLTVHRVDRHSLTTGDEVRDDPDGAVFVELGDVVDGCDIRITDDTGTILKQNHIGNIELSGQSITCGYYNDEKATRKAFTDDGRLKTGDLGFLRNNRLTITGRAKDVIFVNGTNYYAEDIERVIHEQNFADIDPGKIAVAGFFNDRDEHEEILLFIIWSKHRLNEFATLTEEIEQAVLKNPGISITKSIPVRRIPRTTSGKTQRFKLIDNYKKGTYDETLHEIQRIRDKRTDKTAATLKSVIKTGDKNAFKKSLVDLIEQIVEYKIDDYGRGFSEMGFDSRRILTLREILEKTFTIQLPASFAFDYPTLNAMTDRLFDLIGTKEQVKPAMQDISDIPDTRKEEIAVIGMACCFPGSKNPDELWDHLYNGTDLVSPIPCERWNGTADDLPLKQGYFLDRIDLFDADFFTMTPVEALNLDPQQRLLLETTYKALENSGINISELRGSNTGVFIGISGNDYHHLINTGNYALTGTMASTASGRISYVFGFNGPALSIDTACSSSLTAVHQACKSLLTGESSLAIAGGVNLIISPEPYKALEEFGVLAPDGICKTFDDSADGYGRGEGCGIIVLKRYNDALRDGDRILARIKGSAVNHDGASSGLTVPNGRAQEKLLQAALDDAQITADQVDYVEAHGTGTKLGDPQELHAIATVYASRKKDLLVGSVKSTIGHLEAAAGIAGLIKVILALHNTMLPAQRHYHRPNTLIPRESLPITIVATNTAWKKSDRPRIAGISSFGLSGTNAHVIIEEPPVTEPGEKEVTGDSVILAFSAKTPEALAMLAEKYVTYLSTTRDAVIDIGYTGLISRTAFKHRIAVTGKSKKVLSEKLQDYLSGTYSQETVNAADDRYRAMIDGYLEGGTLRPEIVYEGIKTNRVVLPNYPFTKQRYWPGKYDAAFEPDIDQLLYELTWEPESRDDIPGGPPDRHVFGIFPDKKGVAEKIIHLLTDRGKDHVIIDTTRSLCAYLKQGEYTALSLIYLRGLNAVDPDHLTGDILENEQRYYYEELLACIKALHNEKTIRTGKLWIVTHNAVHLSPGEPVSVSPSTLWGFGRTFSLELPHLWGGLIDCDESALSTPASIIDEVTAGTHDQICFKNGQRYIARLKRATPGTKEAPVPFHPDASYLVTGGLGGIGKIFVAWLIKQGVKNIVVTGRRPIQDEPAALFDGADNACDITYLRGDVADKNDVECIVTHIKENMPPLRGIFHLAGILENKKIIDQDWNDFNKTLKPKVYGSWNLHEASTAYDLDYFVLFSSALSVLGLIHTSAYSSANQFMNNLSAYRVHAQLPAISLNWGVWKNVGMTADDELTIPLSGLGIKGIRAETGNALFDRVLTGNMLTPLIVNIDWDTYAHFISDKMKKALYAHLLENRTKDGHAPLFRQLMTKNEGKRLELLTTHVRKLACDVMGYNHEDRLDSHEPLMHYGIDSVMALKIKNKISELIGIELEPTLIFNYPTIHLLSHYLLAIMQTGNTEYKPDDTQDRANTIPVTEHEPIAIIGMGCRFPGGAYRPDLFWDNLTKGADAVGIIPGERWDHDEYYMPGQSTPGKTNTRYGAFIEDIDVFDPHFFGISPKEAAMMDPQQRFVLTVAWEAIENAGLNFDTLRRSNTGVFIGTTGSEYTNQITRNIAEQGRDNYTITGNITSGINGKVSYTFDLTGPSLTIDTACSSSLVAVHYAVKSLQTGESSLALAGGVHLLLNPDGFVGLSQLNALSPDGRCKSFDDGADGFGRGEGCGMIVLKRLSDARRDNDPVLAVIRGSAINQDGKSAGLTAPNGIAQEKVIRTALRNGNITSADIDYIEAHGTGTRLGDPIEIGALASIFKDRKTPLPVGSVKTNIGHLEAAAGIAGIIKVILALQHKQIPGNLHFTTPNAHITWDTVPVTVVDRLTPLPEKDKPLMAGVSSFGITGTNAHIIIEEAPGDALPVSSDSDGYHILAFSAKRDDDLFVLSDRYKHFLASSEENLGDICYTANISRTCFNKRAAFIGRSREELIDALHEYRLKKFSSAELISHIAYKKNSDNEKEVTVIQSYLAGNDVEWEKLYEE